MFADLATITELSGNGREFPVQIFRWIIDEEWSLKPAGHGNRDDLPLAPTRPHSGKRLKFVLKVDGHFELYGLWDAGRMYDNGQVRVEFGPYVIDNGFLVWAMAERHRNKISQLAEDWSASK